MDSADSPRGSTPTTAAPLVTVATYSEAFEAQMARSALAAHGVRAFIADEHLATLNPHYIGAALGIRLQVHGRDLERAAEILSAAATDAGCDDGDDDHDDETDGPRCPQCEARYAYYEWSSGQLLLIVVLMGLPLLFLAKRWHCRKCHATWSPAGTPRALPGSGSPYRAPKRKALRSTG